MAVSTHDESGYINFNGFQPSSVEINDALGKAKAVIREYGLSPKAKLLYWTPEQLDVLRSYIRSDGEITTCDLMVGMNRIKVDMVRTVVT